MLRSVLAAVLMVGVLAPPALARDFSVKTSRVWIVMKDGMMMSRNGDLLMRRYSVFQKDPMLRNTMLLVCPLKDQTNAIHATFVLPKEVLPIPGTTSKTWKPDFQVRVLITKDGRSSSFRTTAEYISGELFIDRTEDNHDMFDLMINADEVSFPIGPKGTIATYVFADKAADETLVRIMQSNSDAKIRTVLEGKEGVEACKFMQEKASKN